ncbi:hypothetical protein AB4Y89_22395 [Terriglobus sp. 2YAB30_2]|uniref:hypothetical protein n=1 Tax=unclassified Terriglobus TaxID=2628988 RepID=UPI003F9C3CF1
MCKLWYRGLYFSRIFVIPQDQKVTVGLSAEGAFYTSLGQLPRSQIARKAKG